ncbi:MAG: RDD family protein [Janthinobacterium lividum]
MSDIPVGSPPAPPGRHAAPGGWYPDPLDLSRERYWDGWQWARDTREGQGRPPYQQPAAAAPAPTPYAQGPWSGGPGSVPPGAAYGGAGVASGQARATADGVPLAGWWWRALAGLIDSLITGTVTLLATFPLYRGLFTAFGTWYSQMMRAAQSGGQPPASPNFAGMMTGSDQLLVMLVTFAIGMAYHLPLLRLRGATLGQLACGLRVVPLDEGRSAGRLPWPSVLVRALLWVLPGALSLRILTVADVLLPLWHPRRQTLHDLAAHTQVVRLRQGG